MGHWEPSIGESNEWFTPKYIFDALGCHFDMDVAAPQDFTKLHVPAKYFLISNGLGVDWAGFVWMNPPFGGRNGIKPWLDRFFEHGDGIALTPDRTSAPWWQEAARSADAVLFIDGKVKFERPDGTLGKSPSNGTSLMAAGERAAQILHHASACGLGLCFGRT